MSLASRLATFAQAVGADVKALTTSVATKVTAVRNLASDTDQVGSWTTVDSGNPTTNWPNRMEFLYKTGASAAYLVTWINEYGELRVMPANANTVGFRIFGKASAAAATRTANVFEIQNNRADRVNVVAIDDAGNIVTAGAVTRVVPGGPTLTTGILKLAAPGTALPAGTPAGTLVVRPKT